MAKYRSKTGGDAPANLRPSLTARPNFTGSIIERRTSIRGCKVILVGDPSVGKSCLMNRFVHDDYSECHPTVGTDVQRKTLDLNGRRITLDVWDPSGQEKHQSLGRLHFQDAKAAIMCFDITEEDSFEYVKRYWLNQVLEHNDCKKT